MVVGTTLEEEEEEEGTGVGEEEEEVRRRFVLHPAEPDTACSFMYPAWSNFALYSNTMRESGASRC